ncbi:MAG: DUF2378 family protein [Polyangiaceae bacterium]
MKTDEPEPHERFAVPDFRRDIDLEAQIRLLPPRATCKGVFFADVLSRGARVASLADIAEKAKVPARSYSLFLDYPHAEWMRITYAVASMIPEGARYVGEGLRHLGQHAFDAMFHHPLGKVIFGPLGLQVERVVASGPLAYKVGLGFGDITAVRVAERHYLYTFRDFPTFLETFNVGVLEGGIAQYYVKPRVRIRMNSLAHCEMEVTWT